MKRFSINENLPPLMCEFYASVQPDTEFHGDDNRSHYPPHVHDMLEVYYLVEGTSAFNVENNIYHLSAGDIIIIKPNEVHNCALPYKTFHKHMCFWFDSSSELLFSALTSHEFGKDNLLSPSPEDKARIKKICLSLAENADGEDKLLVYSLLIDFIYYLNKYAACPSDTVVTPEPLKSILSEMDKLLVSEIDFDALAEKFFISRSTLFRLFKKYMHTTPARYIETKRLARSRVLLRQGKSVSEACAESGFDYDSNYIRVFKRFFGVTPREYKERQALEL